MGYLTVFFLGLLTFTVRLFNLTKIPIFTDEAIYIRWAQVGLDDAAQRYISLTDGKQPLMIWLMYPFLKIFSDPLFAGRFVSVLSGVMGVAGIYMVARELFGKKTALISGLIYVVSPFTMVYDRLALMDSLIAAIGIWSVYLEILLVRKLRLDLALILGMVIGLGMLTKSNAQFFIFSLPFSLLLFNFSQKSAGRKIVRWTGYCVVGTVIALVMYNSLRLSPWFYIINLKNHVFIKTISETVHTPFSVFLANLYGLTDILRGYLTLPVMMLLSGGLLYFLYKKEKKVLFLFLWFIFPYIAFGIFAKVIFPRYLLVMVYPLFIILAHTVVELEGILSPKIRYSLYFIALFFTLSIYQSVLLSLNPSKADIPRADKNQLFDDWPAGNGVREIVSFIRNQSREGRVILGTEGTFGLNPAVYEIYLKKNPNVEIRGYWPVNRVPPDLQESAKAYPTFLVFKESVKVPDDWGLKLVSKYRRGESNNYTLFYQVMPSK